MLAESEGSEASSEATKKPADRAWTDIEHAADEPSASTDTALETAEAPKEHPADRSRLEP